ncbi:carbohydrate kinase family protein [Lederbergia panacisoli]|uniref:carbohydrate kinase family protein n=1 Tax=Lederbergia panacisoli TaxID=1255251 RepID=UPI00214C7DE3|nr:carbohydrate kinase [Lederbergia panacisoli]MCR2823037.1 carbohydrate kinase [Lederbergia panacisoli]
MNHNSSVICIGELLIDFYCTDIGNDLLNGSNFEKQAGGAPANVCATIARLGGNALFAGKVGNDPFGHFLKNTLDSEKVDTSMLQLDKNYPTTLAFVSLKENGERDFVFNRGADAFLLDDEINYEKLKNASILHFGSATALLSDPFQSTYLNTMKFAQEEGKLISFDPNFRKDLWGGHQNEFVNLVKKCLSIANFVKVSDEELSIISSEKNISKGVEFFHNLGVKALAVTLGKDGTLISNGNQEEIIPSINVNSIDSTGAGDAFVGAMLFQLAKETEPELILNDFSKMKEITTMSNKVGALVCTKIGAITSIPTIDEVINIKHIIL